MDTAEGGAAPRPEGPPGRGTFSIEDRPAAGLYVAGWLLSGGGVLLFLVATLTAVDIARYALAIAASLSLGLGLAAAGGYQVVARSTRDASRYRGPSPLLVFGVVLATSTFASLLVLGSGLLDADTAYGFLAGILIVAGAYVFAVWLFAVRTDTLSWRDMGWPAPRPGRARLVLRDIGVAVGVMLPVTLGVLVLGGLVATLLHVEAPQVVPVPGTSLEALAVALAAAIVAPAGEELFFRGFALTAWLRDLGPASAVARSAVFFAIVHVVNVSAATFVEGASQALLEVVVILPLGLVFGLLFVRRGIVASISAHVTYNTILLGLLALRSFGPAGT